MIFKYREVRTVFVRLPIGTVLQDARGNRYMKVDITRHGCWVPSRPAIEGSLTNAEMHDRVGPNWLVWL